MISFWERSSLLHYDIIIVGSGIVGLNTAINLNIRFPNKRIAIFERGILPSGASTKNAGFACFGSLSELVDDAQYSSDDTVYTLFKKRKEGIALLRERLGDQAIDYQANGSHELLQSSETAVLEKLDYYNALLKDLDESAIFTQTDDRIQTFGFDTSYFQHCIAANTEGSIHTGKMMFHLLALAQSYKIDIKTGANVVHYEPNAKGNTLYIKNTINESLIGFSCEKLVFCTNAFSKDFFPEMDIAPGRGQVLITHPIPNLKAKGIFHFDKGYYYFRAIEDRILFGGGRNLDFEGENTSEIALNEAIQDQLLHHLQTIIVPYRTIQIDMQWAGIMAFGKDKSPILYQANEHLFGAFRLGGMGVALGSKLAIDLADCIADSYQ